MGPKCRTVHEGCAAIKNAILCYCVIYDRKEKKLLPLYQSLDCFFFKTDGRIDSSEEPEPVPSTSGVSETAACSLSLIVNDPSALSSPTSSPSSSQ